MSNGKREQFWRASKKSHRSQRHLGGHQSHNRHRCCRACHAGRDVPAREKLDRTSTRKKFVAANIPFKSVEGVHKCMKIRSASVAKPLISCEKVVQAGNVVVLDEKNPHIRNKRDGTVINLDVNNGMYIMDMWVCLDEIGPVFQLARTVSGSSVTNKLVRPGRSAGVRVKKVVQNKS